jgi:hypothetical protein
MHSNYNLNKYYYYKNNENVMSVKKNVIQKMNIVKYHFSWYSYYKLLPRKLIKHLNHG